jgi:adenylate cyclase
MSRLWLSYLGPLAWSVGGVLLLLLVAMAAESWRLPVLGFAERWLHDLRVAAFAPVIEPHPAILIVAFDEDTLSQTLRRSPLDRALLARALTVLEGADPRAIGVDILLDQPTTPEDDAALLASLAGIQVPVVLAHATVAGTEGWIRDWQETYLQDLFARLADTQVRPGSVVLQTDADGSVRRLPAPVPDGPAPFSGLLAGFASEAPYVPGQAIAFRRAAGDDWPFVTLPVHVIADSDSNTLRSVAQDRIVLVGALLADTDRHRTPLNARSGASMAGLGVHAQIIAQLIDGLSPWRPSAAQRWILACLVVAAGVLLGAVDLAPVLRLVLALLSLGLLWGGAIALQFNHVTAGGMIPLAGATAGWIAAFLLANMGSRAVVTEERRFVREALAKYVPPSVARELERHPEQLAIGGERRQVAVLFTDIAGFTSLSERLDPEEVSKYLNAYLDGMTDIVHRHAGTLDKYIGDAVVALWGAPLAVQDPAGRAIACAIELDAFASAFAEARQRDGVAFGGTRIGVHYGEAVVGNFGGRDRYQYTAIGDTINTAARLEGANKFTLTRILVSEAAVTAANRTDCRPLGGLVLKGRRKIIDVFEPVPQLPETARTAHWKAFAVLRTDLEEGLRQLRGLAAASERDVALAAFVRRVSEAGSPVFELESK